MTKPYGTPGPRAVYPEMCDSPSLGRCGVLANLLFPRLVAQADDQGRLAGGAGAVLLQCLPRLLDRLEITVAAVDQALAELHEAGMLLRYVVHTDPYLQLSSWWRWQSSMRRAYPSRWPAPRGWYDLVYGLGGPPQSFTEAAVASPARNAAIRGTSQRSATPRASAGTSAGTSAGARRVPNRTVPDPISAGAGEPPPAPGARGAGAGPARFSDLVPPPPGHRRPVPAT